jgi:hypothetical protein
MACDQCKQGHGSETPDYLVEDVLQLVLGQRRALDVLDGSELPGHPLASITGDRRHLLLCKLVSHGSVVAEIDLGADDEARDTGAVVVDLGKPLFPDVFKAGRGGYAEADEEDVGLRVGERPEAVVVFLSGRVEEAQSVRLVANPGSVNTSRRLPAERNLHDRDGIVVEDSRHVLGGELVGRVGNEQAGLSNSSVTDDHASSRKSVEVRPL